MLDRNVYLSRRGDIDTAATDASTLADFCDRLANRIDGHDRGVADRLRSAARYARAAEAEAREAMKHLSASEGSVVS